MNTTSHPATPLTYSSDSGTTTVSTSVLKRIDYGHSFSSNLRCIWCDCRPGGRWSTQACSGDKWFGPRADGITISEPVRIRGWQQAQAEQKVAA